MLRFCFLSGQTARPWTGRTTGDRLLSLDSLSPTKSCDNQDFRSQGLFDLDQISQTQNLNED